MLEDTKPLVKSQAINLSRGRKPVHGSGGPRALRSAQDRLCRHPAELLATGAGAQPCQVPVLSGISSYRYSGYLTHQVHKVELFSHTQPWCLLLQERLGVYYLSFPENKAEVQRRKEVHGSRSQCPKGQHRLSWLNLGC